MTATRNPFLFTAALFVLLSMSSVQGVRAGVVDTISFWSESLQQISRCVIIVPDSYQQHASQRYASVYLLHGYSGNFSNWVSLVPPLADYADTYQVIIICPDGKNSWYLDRPGSAYESLVTRDLLRHVDSAYRTYPDRSQRAITGLSMGGHGAFYLALRQKGLFAAAGSMSGVLDIVPWRHKYELGELIGDTSSAAAANYSVLYRANVGDSSLALIFDCGTDDPFIDVNRRMHDRLLQLRVPHVYMEKPGGHTWRYWAGAVEYHLLFFRRHFDKAGG